MKSEYNSVYSHLEAEPPDKAENDFIDQKSEPPDEPKIESIQPESSRSTAAAVHLSEEAVPPDKSNAALESIRSRSSSKKKVRFKCSPNVSRRRVTHPVNGRRRGLTVPKRKSRMYKRFQQCQVSATIEENRRYSVIVLTE